MMTPYFGTETQFINREIDTWGESYITDLLNKGYVAVFTTAGWKWQMPVVVERVREVLKS